ncbi:hypothetical protein VC83_08650 [Pseudogymnoascus destructans]|uniref:GAF domain-containing protein n=2 Tax=Pseudogymnoascus destructans TaxID=655981 RepID=L8FNB3_PSED2|nr:uncharacterized protein VC83_08650 [Pseudogymnoascus destructans]ELR02029.1 hypothetical protein GMDG_05191 [Pseudogymnoascus destructans 20631-21]OAF54863.1 hypothetical protein VC83_08650 [Pseudogymnoascus destructans]
MASNSGNGSPFNGRETVKGFPHNSQDALQDTDDSTSQQPASATKSSKNIFKNFFKGSGKSDKSGNSVNASSKKPGLWKYPEALPPPTPMQIHQIMHASPEHLAKVAADKAKEDAKKAKENAELKQQGNVQNQGNSEDNNHSTDSVVVSPPTGMKWSFDGKSMITYKEPGINHFNPEQSGEPGTAVPQGIWPGQTTIPHGAYQREMVPGMVPRMWNEASASISGPAVWTDVQEVGAFGSSFPDGYPPEHVHEPRSEPPSHPIDMSLLRSVYEIAEAAYVQGLWNKADWIEFLEQLRAGVFSNTRPPKPPAIDPLFSFLPAMDPVNEEGRLASLFNIERVWTPRQESRAKELVKASKEEFAVTGVSISLIDNSNEILKAETTYNCRMIKRSVSIAAHALLTTEVLVILDTTKDWRFAKNPLVLNEPKIRFFAGAPILSKNGEAVGVFAVFGRVPRDSFPALQRHSLIDYAAVCAAELNTILEKSFSEQSLHSLQSEAITEVWDPTCLQGEPTPRPRSLWMHEETHRLLCGEPREDEKDIKYPTTFEELMAGFATESEDEDTARDSEEQLLAPYKNGAHANVTYSSVDVNSSTPAKERYTAVSDYALLGSDNEGPDSPLGGRSNRGSDSPASEGFVWRPDSPTSQGLTWGPKSALPTDYLVRPQSPIMRSCTPRPYSVSDLTSTAGEPHENTPAEREFDKLEASSQKVQGVVDGAISALQSEFPDAPIRRQRKKSIRSISQYEAELKRLKMESDIREAHIQATKIDGSSSTVVTGSSNTSGQPSTQATTLPTSFNTRMSTLEFADTHRRPEADAAAKSVALSLKFDRVYVAEIFPSSDLMTPGRAAVTGMGVRILASHNCPHDMILDTDFHLQVLRSPLGAMSWHDKDALPGATDKSLLIRLHSKGPYGVSRDLHTGGIVYGAVHLAQSQGGDDAGITNQEQATIFNAANAMKLILFKKNDKRERKDSSCVNCNTPSHVGTHTAPAAASKAEGAGPEHSIPSTMETPKAKDAGPKLPNPVSAFEAEYEDYPNAISMESVQEATKAVAEVMKFNMEEILSPQW